MHTTSCTVIVATVALALAAPLPRPYQGNSPSIWARSDAGALANSFGGGGDSVTGSSGGTLNCPDHIPTDQNGMPIGPIHVCGVKLSKRDEQATHMDAPEKRDEKREAAPAPAAAPVPAPAHAEPDAETEAQQPMRRGSLGATSGSWLLGSDGDTGSASGANDICTEYDPLNTSPWFKPCAAHVGISRRPRRRREQNDAVAFGMGDYDQMVASGWNPSPACASWNMDRSFREFVRGCQNEAYLGSKSISVPYDFETWDGMTAGPWRDIPRCRSWSQPQSLAAFFRSCSETIGTE
ncbi:MAG: hypothetical protein M1838_000492 [Thelocarpon superellum]|nr:MAG: hypothetical protein M1838_000492 [Thelocarpon superellum]